jgi:hypothetical protein
METTADQYSGDITAQPQRPDFLKIICILSFIACGLMILLCAIGSICLTFDADMIDKFWSQVVESSPQLAELDPVKFIHEFGMVCVYTLIANIFSLIGVIMMWRLEKMGFFIYVVAELTTHFFTIDMGTQENKSYVGLILSVLVDLGFITMYFLNLKYMNKKNNNTFIQSGS